MFGQGKPLASLSSGLLARKGEARPAMRRPAALPVAEADDLGWNDMGEPAPEPAPIPAVLVEREALAEEVTAPSISLATAQRIDRETSASGKAAFTLRLDGDRHLRLRLAAATRHRSAQQLVTQALDAFLQTLPEVEALARQLPSRAR